MIELKKYKLISGSHTRYENNHRVQYGPGDVFMPTESELRAFQDKLTPVQEVEAKKEPNNMPTESEQEQKKSPSKSKK